MKRQQTLIAVLILEIAIIIAAVSSEASCMQQDSNLPRVQITKIDPGQI